MRYAAFILIVLVQGIRCQENCTIRTNNKKDFCVTSCNSTQSNCSGNSACVCDGDCGYSCVSRDLRCARPDNIAQGRVRYRQNTFSSIAKYKCFEPYQLVGPKKRTCRGNGNWDGKKPVCKVICQDPGNIQHGKKYHDGFESGKKVKYRCLPGFTIQGRGTLTCTRTGQWDREKPSCTCVRTNKRAYRYCKKDCDPNGNTCKGNKDCICDGDCGYSCVSKGLSCGRPQQIQNGRRQYSSTRLSSSVKYQCNKPYELIGSSVRTCRGIREWDGVQPQCKIVCQDPGDIEFGTKEVSGMRDEKGYLTVGDRVKYNCFPNYNMEGSMLLTCDERGRWDNPKPNCTLPSCRPPTIPSNAELMRSRREKTSFRFNDRVMLRCKSGYFKSGTGISLLACGSKGWSGLSIRCLPKSCGNPGTPTNGKIKSYIFTFKSKVYFECNYGYRLLGDEYRQCQSNQKWSGRIPSCEQIDCGDLPTPDKAEKVMQTHTRVGGFVRFKCKERGYEIIGSEMRDCQETGLWSGITTSCKIISCGDPGTPLNGKKINVKNNFNFGGSVEFACNDNYTLAGDRVIQCEEDKDWNLPIPRCFAPCSDPGVPGDGSRIGDDFRHDRSVSFTCQEGFELDGDKTITCSDGRWSGERPQCEVVSCGDPGNPFHGRKKKNPSFTYGGIVRFKCDKDYILRGKSKLRCQANKKWNGELPQCLAPCLNPGQLLHGRIIGYNLTHDSLIKFECLSGFSLKGSPAMRCNDGTWNTTKPTCTDCDGGKPLGMQSGEIPDSSIRASSQTDQHPAHHGRLGGKSFWCSKDEGRSFIDIDLPKEYKITAVSIENVQDRKIGVGVFTLFFNKVVQFHAERPSRRPGERRIVLRQPMIAKNIKIVLTRPRRVTTSVCLRAEVYGCKIPRGCVMPGSAVLGLVGGIYWKGKLVESQHDNFEFVCISGFKTLGKTDFVPDEIPEPEELSEGILVLVKENNNSDLFREGKIAQTGDPWYTVETNDGGSRLVNVGDIRVVKEPNFCPP